MDDAGAPIQAHGGWVLPVAPRDPGAGTEYYWYGEDKSGVTVGRRMDAIGIRCYRSRDLVSWHDCGLVLRSDPASELDVLRPSGVMERPRVLRCPATGRYSGDYSFSLSGQDGRLPQTVLRARGGRSHSTCVRPKSAAPRFLPRARS